MSFLAGAGALVVSQIRWRRQQEDDAQRADGLDRREADMAKARRQAEGMAAKLADVRRRIAEVRQHSADDLAAVRARLAA